MFRGALQFLCDWITSVLNNFSDSSALTGNLGSYYSGMFDWAVNINRSIASPIAYEILALFLVIELAQIAFRTAENNTNGMVGVSSLIKLAIKYGLCKAVIDHNQTILKALFNLSKSATSGIAGISGMGTSIDYGFPTDILSNVISTMFDNIGTQLIALILLLITFLIALVGSLVLKTVITLRFIHLYSLFAFSPIPLSSLMADGQWNMAPSFIKNWLATCFHGCILFFIVGGFQYIASDVVQDNVTLLGASVSIMSIVIILIVCLLSAERLAMKLFGA